MVKITSEDKIEVNSGIELNEIRGDDKSTNDHTGDITAERSTKLDSKMINNLDQEGESDLTYNPNGIPTWQAFFLNFKALIGIGVLAFPHIVQEVGYGYALSTYLLIFCSLLYGVDLIIQVADSAKYYEQSLEDFVEIVLGKNHRMFTTITNWIFGFAVSIANVIFSVQFIQYAICQMGLCFEHSRIYYNLIGLCICLPTCFIHDIKNFKWMAMGAMAAILTSVIAISVYEIKHISENGINTTTVDWNIERFPEYFGVVCFSVEGVGTIIPIRSQMKHRKQFRPMFLSTMYGIGLVLIVFGVLGVFCFGSDIKDIVFLNFPKTETFIFSLMMAYGLGCILTFPVYINVTCNIIFRVKKFQNCFLNHEKSYWYCCILRLATILCVFAISISGLKILD